MSEMARATATVTTRATATVTTRANSGTTSSEESPLVLTLAELVGSNTLIISKIGEYLPLSSLRECRLVNKTWEDAIRPHFSKRTRIFIAAGDEFGNVYPNPGRVPRPSLAEFNKACAPNPRGFQNFALPKDTIDTYAKDPDDPELTSFFQNYGGVIQSLMFNLKWQEIHSFLRFISQLDKLEELILYIDFNQPYPPDPAPDVAAEAEGPGPGQPAPAQPEVEVPIEVQNKSVSVELEPKAGELKIRINKVTKLTIGFIRFNTEDRDEDDVFGEIASTVFDTFPSIVCLSLRNVSDWLSCKLPRLLRAFLPHLERKRISGSRPGPGLWPKVDYLESFFMNQTPWNWTETDALEPLEVFGKACFSKLSLKFQREISSRVFSNPENQNYLVKVLQPHQDTLEKMELELPIWGFRENRLFFTLPILPQLRSLTITARFYEYFPDDVQMGSFGMDFHVNFPNLEELHLLCWRGVDDEDEKARFWSFLSSMLSWEEEPCTSLKTLECGLLDDFEKDLSSVPPKIVLGLSEKFPNLTSIVASQNREIKWTDMRENYAKYCSDNFARFLSVEK